MKHLYTPEIRDLIIQHIDEFRYPEDADVLADQVRAWMHACRQDMPLYAGIKLAGGGRFLVATEEQRDFLETVGYNVEQMPDTLVMHRYGFSIGIGFAEILEREKNTEATPV